VSARGGMGASGIRQSAAMAPRARRHHPASFRRIQGCSTSEDVQRAVWCRRSSEVPPCKSVPIHCRALPRRRPACGAGKLAAAPARHRLLHTCRPGEQGPCRRLDFSAACGCATTLAWHAHCLAPTESRTALPPPSLPPRCSRRSCVLSATRWVMSSARGWRSTL
jgi:hypothetical protein